MKIDILDIIEEYDLHNEIINSYSKYDRNAVKATKSINENIKNQILERDCIYISDVFEVIDIIKYWRDSGIKSSITVY